MAPIIEIARWTVVILFSLVLGFAAFSDIKDRRIPNWTVLAVAALFVAWVFVGPGVSIVASLEAALIVFVLSVVFYLLKIVGAGDSKLITVVTLFMGPRLLPEFALITALAGGALAVFSLALNPTRTLVMIKMHFRGEFGRGIPYGVAIALGGIATILPHVT
jgi:prepilin peptidase CpaA